MGQSPPSRAYNDEKNGLPFYQGKADFGLISPTPRKYCTEPNRIAEKNDVLISVRAPVGPTNLATEKCCIGRGLAAIRCQSGVLPQFLFYALRSIQSKIAESVKDQGGGFTAIKRDQLGAFKIPVPPLDEQRRIVTRIEELTRRAEEAQQLRHEAVEKVNHIFQIELERIFSSRRTTGWQKIVAGAAFDIVKGQVDPWKEPYASMLHVAPDVIEIGTGRLFEDKIKTATELELKSGKYPFDTSHVLYSKIRPNLRKALEPGNQPCCSLRSDHRRSNDSGRLRPDSNGKGRWLRPFLP
jgi:type I restriction enzyme, S subunit